MYYSALAEGSGQPKKIGLATLDVRAPVPVQVPTMTGWGIFLLVTLIGVSTLPYLRKIYC